jgi:hypothetical protein
MNMKKILIFFLVFNFLIFPFKQVFGKTTELIFEPSLVEAPYLNIEDVNSFIEISLKVLDVRDLKEFHIRFDYNDDILEYYSAKIDRTFYLSGGGGTGGALDKVIQGFSGSITMYKYTFRVNGPGITSITLEDSELIDSSGNPIPFEGGRCLVSVIPFEEYLGSSYVRLQEDYVNLYEDFNNLEQNYSVLLSEKKLLDDEYFDLIEKNTELNKTHEETLNQLKNITFDYNSLIEQNVEIENDYEELEKQYNEKIDETLELKLKVIETRNYLIIAATIAIVFIIMYFARR